MASEFELRIVHRPTGVTVAQWAPRRPETDGDVIDDLCARVRAKGIGVGRTEAHVIADLRWAWQELLHDFKRQVG